MNALLWYPELEQKKDISGKMGEIQIVCRLVSGVISVLIS